MTFHMSLLKKTWKKCIMCKGLWEMWFKFTKSQALTIKLVTKLFSLCVKIAKVLNVD